MKRILAVAALLTIVLSGCAIGSRPAAQPVLIPDVVGLAGDEASALLEDAGFEVEFDAGEDSVWKASNWMVDSQSPEAAAKAQAGALVVLVVSKPAAEIAPPPVELMNSQGLTADTAQTVCELAGVVAYPYGWDAHWIIDRQAETLNADDTWFLKVGVDITNEYDAERKAVAECVVGGSEDLPSLVSFNVY